MDTLPIRYALLSAVGAGAASIVGVTLHISAQEPKALLLGLSFGFSLAPHSALLALPAGLLLGFLRPRVGRQTFVIVATLAGAVLGGVLGMWLSSTSEFFMQTMAGFLACTWALAACALSFRASGARAAGPA